MPSYLFFFSVLRSIHIYGVLVLLQMEHCQSKALTTNNRNQTALRAHFATFTCDCFPTIVTNYATIAFRQSSFFLYGVCCVRYCISTQLLYHALMCFTVEKLLLSKRKRNAMVATKNFFHFTI